MMKKIAAVLGLVLVAFLAFVATRPNHFRVERSIVINAPPEVIFGILNDFHNGKDWSPWDKRDPHLKQTFSGPESGVGATYAWEGNDEVGKGKQTITEAVQPSKVVTTIHFMEPFEAHNTAEYLIDQEGSSSRVTWAISGPCPFISKLMGVIMDMDAMIGKDFEAGLASLKILAESRAQTVNE